MPLPTSPALLDPPAPRTGTVGRPRLLTREAILVRAVALGLDKLTMKQLALALGVGTATLYQYFDDRDALMRAAASWDFATKPLPRCDGASWQQFVRDYAYAMQTLFADNPSYVQYYLHGDYGFGVELELVEQFLNELARFDFAAETAMRLLRALSMAAIAGANEIRRERAFAARGDNVGRMFAQRLAQCQPDDWPNVRRAGPVFVEAASRHIDDLLDPLIRDTARMRGEAPAAAG